MGRNQIPDEGDQAQGLGSHHSYTPTSASPEDREFPLPGTRSSRETISTSYIHEAKERKQNQHL